MQLAPPPLLPVIKIVKYCGVWGRGGGAMGGGAKILQKIMTPPLSVNKIEQYCGTRGGGGAMGGAKILQKIKPPPLSVIKIEQYCSTRGGGALETLKSYEDNGAPSLLLRLLSIGGFGGHYGMSKSYKR